MSPLNTAITAMQSCDIAMLITEQLNFEMPTLLAGTTWKIKIRPKLKVLFSELVTLVYNVSKNQTWEATFIINIGDPGTSP